MSDETTPTTAPEGPHDALVSEFLELITPMHHRAAASMPTSLEISYAALREVLRGVLERRVPVPATTEVTAPAPVDAPPTAPPMPEATSSTPVTTPPQSA